MIPPFAPLYPWLRDALGHQVVRSSAGLPRFASSHYPTPYEIDLRDLQTRAAVLRALADAGHARPWALGAPWSPLTDEQAGRATAAILRAVGEDPSKPAGVVPVRVLGPYFGDPKWYYQRQIVGTKDSPMLYVKEIAGSDLWQWRVMGGQWSYATPKAEAMADANNAARALGCLMIEELTPT